MPNTAANMQVGNTIYVQRDYSEGMVPKFQEKFPSELDGIVEPDTYHATIRHLNHLYEAAESMSPTAYWEGTFACLTGYLFLGCTDTQYKKCLKKVTSFLDEQNKTIYWPAGVIIHDPFPTGLRSIQITIYSRQAH